MRNELRNGRPVEQPDPLKTALAALQPSPSRIDRDVVMYRAGQSAAETHRRAARPRRWFWPLATVLSLLAAVTFAGLYGSAVNASRPVRIVYVDRAAPVEITPQRRKAVPAPKPKLRREHPPAFVERRHFPDGTEPTSLVSTVARSRYQILLTNADRLPDSAAGGSTRSSAGQSFGAIRNRVFKQKQPSVTVSTPSLFFWNR